MRVGLWQMVEQVSEWRQANLGTSGGLIAPLIALQTVTRTSKQAAGPDYPIMAGPQAGKGN